MAQKTDEERLLEILQDIADRFSFLKILSILIKALFRRRSWEPPTGWLWKDISIIEEVEGQRERISEAKNRIDKRLEEIRTILLDRDVECNDLFDRSFESGKLQGLLWARGFINEMLPEASPGDELDE